MWASLHGHDYLSLLDGLSSPLDNFSRAIDGNLSAIAISNHGNLSSAIKVLKSRKQYVEKCRSAIGRTNDNQEKELLSANIEKAGKLKLILGNEMYLAVGEKENAHLVVLAKNLQGYKQLIKATSESTRRDNFWRKPRLTLDQLSAYAGDLIVINGHPGSSLYNVLWTDVKASFTAHTYEEARSLVHPDWKARVLREVDNFTKIFGDNFILESQLVDAKRIPAAQVAVNIYRWVAKQTGCRITATSDSHYPTPDRSRDQWILLCSSLRITIPQVKKQIASDEDDIALGGFFLSDKYYLPTAEEMIALHTPEEIQTSLDIANSCEEYDLSSKPIIPTFACPGGIPSNEYMRQICREGWKNKLVHGEDRRIYGDRMKNELSVLEEANLADYFLIEYDIVQWIKNQGYWCGPGRGSAGGALTSYLMGITAVDPIPPGLIFERFYNAGRNAPGRISMPDIDLDVEAGIRDKVINYIKEKFVHVGQISNYGRLMGRACLKDVLRAHEACDFQTMNEICKFIPDEAAIADELQEMSEETGEKSIIKWALEHNKKELSEWVNVQEDGRFVGPLGTYFEQACRLEGTYRQRGIHAAAVVIYPSPITDICPVIYDKEGNAVIAYDMHDVEYTGGNKFDILGTTITDKTHYTELAIQNEFLLEE